MKLKFAYYGNPILRKKAKPIVIVTDEIKELIASMIQEMDDQDGIGLAAPQVNHSLSLFVLRIPKDRGNDEWEKGIAEVFINPKILNSSQIQDFYSEGCLSIPGLYRDILRPIALELEATDMMGQRFTKKFSGLHARAIQHEYDHLQGILFIDHLDPLSRKKLNPRLKRLEKKHMDL